MLFMVAAFDKPGMLETRLRVRGEHLEYLGTLGDRIKMGGAMLNEDEQPLGSLLIIDADDREAIDALLDGDPYTKAGVFERIDVRPWRAALGSWVKT
ncbi:MAG: YciI family protein [Alphaproteobacteria bacterium]|nr:YciI family protein [Alphaproteobacteria bacterium]